MDKESVIKKNLEQIVNQLISEKKALVLENCLLKEENTTLGNELKESEIRYGQIIDQANDMIYRVTVKGIITWVNPYTLQFLGYPKEEIVGKHFQEFVHPDYFKMVNDFYKKILDKNQINAYLEFPLLNNKGETLWVGQNSQLDIQDGVEIGGIAIARNITLRKAIEANIHSIQEQIAASEEKYRSIIENMELGLLEVDNQGTIIKAYDYFCDMTGHTPKEMEGKNAEDLLLPPGYKEIMTTQNKSRLKGQAGAYEVQIRKKDGQLIWVVISGAPFYSVKGEVIGSLGIHLDITERKKLEKELEEALIVAENAQKAEQLFLANMSHEIRTPLNSIIGMAHLLYEIDPNPEQVEYLDLLLENSSVLQSLISDILDISKIQSGTIDIQEKAFDLHDLVHSIEKTFSLKLVGKPVIIHSQIDVAIPKLIIGDKLLLNQILNNLLSNAVKFTEKGAILIKIDVQQIKGECITLKTVVSDTGIGIENDNLDRIFNKFEQLNPDLKLQYGGTGLGLTITKKIVELQNGTINVESKLNQGTAFTVYIPYRFGAEEKIKPTPTQVLKPVKSLENIRILVAEDNPMNQKYIERLFYKWNVKYQLASNGKEALEYLNHTSYDLVLMDLQMPELNGIEAVKKLRASSNQNKDIPVIALTAAAFPRQKKLSIQAGMDGFLSKPYAPDQLLDILKRYAVKVEGGQSTAKVKESYCFSEKLNSDYLKKIYGDDLKHAAIMFETFLEHAHKIFSELNPLFQIKDWKGLEQVSHRLKSNLAIVGLTELSEKMEQVEKLCRQNPQAKLIQPYLESFQNEIDGYLPVLKTELLKMKSFYQKPDAETKA